MEEEKDARDFAWKWVTISGLVSHGACEIQFAQLCPQGNSAELAVIYDGENTSGEIVTKIRTGGHLVAPFRPAKPVYCRRGIYIHFVTEVEGLFIQWLEKGPKG